MVSRIDDNRAWAKLLAIRLLEDSSHADDVLQEVWLTLANNPPRGDEAPTIRAWIAKVVRTHALRTNRSEHRRKKREHLVGLQSLGFELSQGRELGQLPLLPAREVQGPTPLSEAEWQEQADRIHQEVSKLPAHYQAVIKQKFFEGLSNQEIAQANSTSTSTLRTQLSRALAMLRERLASTDSDWQRSLAGCLIPMLLIDQVKPLPLGTASGEANLAALSTKQTIVVSALAILLVSVGLIAFLHDPSQGHQTSAPNKSLTNKATSNKAHIDPDSTNANAPGSAKQHIEQMQRPAPKSPNSTASKQTAKALGANSADNSHSKFAQTLIRVNILDGSTHQAVKHAEVFQAAFLAPKAKLVGQSNENGWIDLSAQNAYESTLVIRSPGYMDHWHKIDSLLAQEKKAEITLHLQAQREYELQLEDVNGQAIKRAFIKCSNAKTVDNQSESYELYSDSQGLAQISHKFTNQVMHIEAAGFARKQLLWKPSIGKVILSRGSEMRLLIKDAQSYPIANAFIHLKSQQLQHKLVLQSDEKGYVELGRIAALDDLNITILSADHPPHRLQLPVSAKSPNTLIVRLPAGKHLSGWIKDPFGMPATKALIFVAKKHQLGELAPASHIVSAQKNELQSKKRSDFQLRPVSRARIEEDGYFELGPISEDQSEIRLLVHHNEYVNQAIKLESSKGLINIQLAEGIDFSGQIVDEQHQPIAGLTLFFGQQTEESTESSLGRCTTDSLGFFRFKGLPQDCLDGNDTSQPKGSNPCHLYFCSFKPFVLKAHADEKQTIYRSISLNQKLLNSSQEDLIFEAYRIENEE